MCTLDVWIFYGLGVANSNTLQNTFILFELRIEPENNTFILYKAIRLHGTGSAFTAHSVCGVEIFILITTVVCPATQL